MKKSYEEYVQEAEMLNEIHGCVHVTTAEELIEAENESYDPRPFSESFEEFLDRL